MANSQSASSQALSREPLQSFSLGHAPKLPPQVSQSSSSAPALNNQEASSLNTSNYQNASTQTSDAREPRQANFADSYILEFLQAVKTISKLQKEATVTEVEARQHRRYASQKRNKVSVSDVKFMDKIQHLSAIGEFSASHDLLRLAAECQDSRNNLGPVEQEGMYMEQRWEGCIWNLRQAEDELLAKFQDLFTTAELYPETQNSTTEEQRGTILGSIQHSNSVISDFPRHTLALPPALDQVSQISSTAPSPQEPSLLQQLEVPPVPLASLVADVNRIYVYFEGLEAQCIKDIEQTTLVGNPEKKQCHNAFTHHQCLIGMCHDFLLGSQHPSADHSLRRLAGTYKIPERTWSRIYGFLGFLSRLPNCLDDMLSFFNLAYSFICVVYETIPAFKTYWTECLGHLAKERWAIEKNDFHEKEVWKGTARDWYSKVTDMTPDVGRLYLHTAIVAGPNALEQLFYYQKALHTSDPFEKAKEGILTFFMSALNGRKSILPPLETAFIKAHSLLFTRDTEMLKPIINEFLELLDNYIGRVTRKFLEHGGYIAMANISVILEYGEEKNTKLFEYAKQLSNSTLKIVLRRIGDPNVLSFVHVTLVFLYHLATNDPKAIRQLDFPWEDLTVMLNTFANRTRFKDSEFLGSDKKCVLAEDFLLRGFKWVNGGYEKRSDLDDSDDKSKYFPDDWFHDVDTEGLHLQHFSTPSREERIWWLAHRLVCLLGHSIYYDGYTHQFSPQQPPQQIKKH